MAFISKYIVAFSLLFLLQLQLRAQQISIADLRCELLQNPVGIDVPKPRLSWEIKSNERNIYQTAYQIIASSSLKKLNNNEADIWNSGKINSDKSVQVLYNGTTLKSGEYVYWKVKVWTNKSESDWSETNFWSTGLLNTTDWKAAWTGIDKAFPRDDVSVHSRLSSRYYRKEIAVNKKIKSATLYISGLGLYELFINGKKIGTQVLSPSPTDYDKTVMYNTYDVTDYLQRGRNAIGVTLGNGRYFIMRQNYKPKKWHSFGFPKLLLQTDIEYEDGSHQLIVSDTTWKMTADGPVRSNNEYDGEDYDATKEMNGWNEIKFNDKDWLHASIVEAPSGKLKAQMNENMQVMQTLRPKSIRKYKDGIYILDMGQNFAGYISMKLNGNGHRGDTATLRYAESLQPDGSLYVANLRDAKATDHYIIKGTNKEQWHPRFVYHGFRYVEIKGLPKAPSLKDFEGEVVYDHMSTTGSFVSSDTTLNQIYHNAYWSIRSDYKGMPVDCPQRNERQPWLGDRTTGCYGESFVLDNAKLYAKWLNDIQDAQTSEGSIPDVAPNFWFYYKDDVTWPSTYLTVADMLYKQYGDSVSIAAHYASMKKWIFYMQEKYMKNYMIDKDSYGDWCVPPESKELIHSKDSSRMTSGALLATAAFYHDLQLMKKFAALIHQSKDTAAYSALAMQIKKAFNGTFYNSSKRCYGNNSVTSNLLPLAFGLANKEDEAAIFQNIILKIKDFNDHIPTGVIGTQWLMRMLTKYGRNDLAYKIATNRDYPGWGYMSANGATTTWELWNGNTADPKMNSQNHVMLLGDLLIWLYENQAGIQTDSEDIAFKKIIMKPEINSSLQFVNASYHSLYGEIESSWKKSGNDFNWTIHIPANTAAVVYLPANENSRILENDKDISLEKDIIFLRKESGYNIYQIGSGNYHFISLNVINNK